MIGIQRATIEGVAQCLSIEVLHHQEETVTFASEIVLADGKANVPREIDGGLQTIAINLPAIVTTDLRLNEPRYASLPNIMKAKKKEIAEMTPEELGVDIAPRLTTLTVTEPPKREGGIKVETVSELVEKLKNEAGVI